MDGRGPGFFVALSIALLPGAVASPMPDPTIPAPDEFHVAYDAASDTMTLTWNTPDGLSEEAVAYLVYVNGESSTYTPDPLTVLVLPDVPTVVSVATVSNGHQSLMSMPLLFGLDDPEFLRVAFLLAWEGEGHFPLEPCPLIILGINPNPPYVFQFDWECIPEPVRTILWELLH